jgi:hypothetical protein
MMKKMTVSGMQCGMIEGCKACKIWFYGLGDKIFTKFSISGISGTRMANLGINAHKSGLNSLFGKKMRNDSFFVCNLGRKVGSNGAPGYFVSYR